jgi:hypothetical protein
MWGIPKSDKIKAAFKDFDTKVAGHSSPDPVVQLIVEFIRALSQAFK